MSTTEIDPLPSEGYNPPPMGRKIQRSEGGDATGGPSIGDRIRAARDRAGFTQGQAAGRMPNNVTVQYWSDVENGRRTPSLEWLWEAARAIGCNPHSLDERLASKRWPKT